MAFVPLAVVVGLVILAAFLYASWETKRNREHPELGPVRDDRYWWQDSLRPRGNVDRGEPPISNDPGAGGFIDG